MLTIYLHELRRQSKTTLIWSLSVGLMGLCCILLFGSLESQMQAMAESYASMGSFSEAFGMDRLSIATITGFFATEIGSIHTIGTALFAAAIATTVISKEEEGHTGEFLLSLPVSRLGICFSKIFAVTTNIVLYSVLCGLCYRLGLAFSGESIDTKAFFLFILMQLLMGLEIASICLVISACSRTGRLPVGIGVAMSFYIFDLMARILPDLTDYIGIGALSYANATDIFVSAAVETEYLAIGIGVTLASLFATCIVYNFKDIAG